MNEMFRWSSMVATDVFIFTWGSLLEKRFEIRTRKSVKCLEEVRGLYNQRVIRHANLSSSKVAFEDAKRLSWWDVYYSHSCELWWRFDGNTSDSMVYRSYDFGVTRTWCCETSCSTICQATFTTSKTDSFLRRDKGFVRILWHVTRCTRIMRQLGLRYYWEWFWVPGTTIRFDGKTSLVKQSIMKVQTTMSTARCGAASNLKRVFSSPSWKWRILGSCNGRVSFATVLSCGTLWRLM